MKYLELANDEYTEVLELLQKRSKQLDGQWKRMSGNITARSVTLAAIQEHQLMIQGAIEAFNGALSSMPTL